MTKKPKKNHNTLYRVVFCVIDIIFDICAFLFCAAAAIAYAMEGKMWPDGFAFIAVCIVIAWQHIRDLRIYLKDKQKGKPNEITLPAELGTRIYFVPLERDQVECGEVIGGAATDGKTFMILKKIYPLNENEENPYIFKMKIDSTFFFSYEDANAHLAELLPKLTAAEAADRISEVARKAGRSVDDASRAHQEILKAVKEATGYAED